MINKSCASRVIGPLTAACYCSVAFLAFALPFICIPNVDHSAMRQTVRQPAPVVQVKVETNTIERFGYAKPEPTFWDSPVAYLKALWDGSNSEDVQDSVISAGLNVKSFGDKVYGEARFAAENPEYVVAAYLPEEVARLPYQARGLVDQAAGAVVQVGLR